MTDATRQAAEALLAVRRGAPRIPDLGALAPADEAGALAVQRAVLAGNGGSIGGWKCAFPPGKPHSCAMLDSRGIRPAPTGWAVPPGETIGIETEIAFRMGRDLPARATPYGREEVVDAIAAAFPAMEMVATRFIDLTKVPFLDNMADGIAHAGLVLGAEVPGWREMDLGALTVRQTCGGAVQVEKVGGNPAGDPLVSLIALANHLPRFGLHLRAGEVVTTGSCTGLIWVKGRQRVTGGFAGFGEVVVDLG
ncbi:2-keto-4-pentenoate hydratase [Falsiroseomonas sp. CW058]|uniref:2-keto-4-pentenoate hydratase n=1 Tax=Falsiroseomonas sp. CW058 TaxID=3388664 RepID=UPI003D31E2E4